MKDWFFQKMTIGDADRLYEQMQMTTQVKNGEVIVAREYERS